MSKKKLDQDEIISKLPGDLREVAELVGVENTVRLVERYGGTYIRVPKCDELLRDIRNKKIRDLYDTGNYDIRALAVKFKLTDRHISTILSETDEEVPLPLIALLTRKSI